MCALKTQDQGIIDVYQMDYLPVVISSFLVDRKAQGLSDGTVDQLFAELNYAHCRSCFTPVYHPR